MWSDSCQIIQQNVFRRKYIFHITDMGFNKTWRIIWPRSDATLAVTKSVSNNFQYLIQVLKKATAHKSANISKN